jgi:hypothetical protein
VSDTNSSDLWNQNRISNVVWELVKNDVVLLVHFVLDFICGQD